MIKAFQLIFFPFKTWEKIAASQRAVPWILLLHLLPFLLVGVALEGYSLTRFGEERTEISSLVKVPEATSMRYAATQCLLLVASILIGAKLLQWITHSFQVENSYRQTFTLLAYGFSPFILARYADAVPSLPTWVCWVIGVLLSASALYHGVGLVLKPEQTKGFGLYLVSVLLVMLSAGIVHLTALAVLRGKFWR
jgi:hypothetical protein